MMTWMEFYRRPHHCSSIPFYWNLNYQTVAVVSGCCFPLDKGQRIEDREDRSYGCKRERKKTKNIKIIKNKNTIKHDTLVHVLEKNYFTLHFYLLFYILQLLGTCTTPDTPFKHIYFSSLSLDSEKNYCLFFLIRQKKEKN